MSQLQEWTPELADSCGTVLRTSSRRVVLLSSPLTGIGQFSK